MPDCRKCKKSVKKRSHTIMWRIWVSCQILSSVSLLVKLQKEEILQELGYLNGGVLEPYKVLFYLLVCLIYLMSV